MGINGLCNSNMHHINSLPARGDFCCPLITFDRSGPTWSGTKLFDTDVFREFFVWKMFILKKSADDKKYAKLPSMQKVNFINLCPAEEITVISFLECQSVHLYSSIYCIEFTDWVENRVDPDQLASVETNWSGAALFS